MYLPILPFSNSKQGNQSAEMKFLRRDADNGLLKKATWMVSKMTATRLSEGMREQ